jgi:hypothetical protein
LIADQNRKLDLRDLLLEAVEPIARLARSVGDRDDLHFIRLDKEVDYVTNRRATAKRISNSGVANSLFSKANGFSSIRCKTTSIARQKRVAESNTLCIKPQRRAGNLLDCRG